MAKIHLVHWHADEAEERANALRSAGHEVAISSDDGSRVCRRLREDPVDCLVVDLRRLPSHGASTALEVRQRKATAHLPIVFVEGDPEKSVRIAAKVPAAVLVPWSRVRTAVRTAARRSVAVSAKSVGGGVSAGYSGRTLPAKLGIKAGSRLLLLGAPADFEGTLGELPDGVRVRRRAGGAAETVVLFAKRLAELERRLAVAAAATLAGGSLWIAWPKKSSGLDTDVTQALVRERGLATGLVDVKVAAIDATWSGHQFRHRRT